MAGPSFEFVPHTADVAARLQAPTLAGLFEAAASACSEALTAREEIRASEERTLGLPPAEPELLLVDWLHELLYLFEAEDFLVRETRVALTAVEPAGSFGLHATLRGERRDGTRHALNWLIKAVTYHGLRITQGPDGYTATVVFDV